MRFTVFFFFSLEPNQYDGSRRMSTASTRVQIERRPKYGHVPNPVPRTRVYAALSPAVTAGHPVKTAHPTTAYSSFW